MAARRMMPVPRLSCRWKSLDDEAPGCLRRRRTNNISCRPSGAVRQEVPSALRRGQSRAAMSRMIDDAAAVPRFGYISVPAAAFSKMTLETSSRAAACVALRRARACAMRPSIIDRRMPAALGQSETSSNEISSCTHPPAGAHSDDAA